jgi:hypothetical protein
MDEYEVKRQGQVSLREHYVMGSVGRNRLICLPFDEVKEYSLRKSSRF